MDEIKNLAYYKRDAEIRKMKAREASRRYYQKTRMQSFNDNRQAEIAKEKKRTETLAAFDKQLADHLASLTPEQRKAFNDQLANMPQPKPAA